MLIHSTITWPARSKTGVNIIGTINTLTMNRIMMKQELKKNERRVRKVEKKKGSWNVYFPPASNDQIL